MDPKQSDALERVMDLVRYLRAHCPWDGAQTPRSLIPYLLEEAHESADAIAEGDDDALRSELGDLLLNIAFQLVLGQERAAFDADAVADTVIDKMERRHPHLFGGGGEPEDWETLKARERDDDASLLHGVARGLDPLSKAHRIQDRVAGVGFDWADYHGAFAKVAEELEEVREALEERAREPESREPESREPESREQESREPESREPESREPESREPESREPESRGASPETPGAGSGTPASVEGTALEEELGDLLFAVVNLTRLAGAHPLTALQRANAKFSARFREVERRAAERGIVLGEASLEELDALWEEIKREGP